jgi:hypothetical protein
MLEPPSALFLYLFFFYFFFYKIKKEKRGDIIFKNDVAVMMLSNTNKMYNYLLIILLSLNVGLKTNLRSIIMVVVWIKFNY